MALKLRWVGADEMDRVAEVRMLAYASGRDKLAHYQADIRDDPRMGAGDWLIAERDGVPVGTASNVGLTMWVRGGAIKCQGVASVGTVKNERRRTGSGAGIGSSLMHECLRRAKEHGCVASALMPFRVSFYEKFGYGVVEHKKEWTIPLNIIPQGDFESIRYYRDGDFDELLKCRQRLAEANQCDIERTAASWRWHIQRADAGFFFVDRAGDGPVRGWMLIEHSAAADGSDTVRAFWDFGWEDIASFKRFLHFLGSLRDQYRYASAHLPADFPLNLLLKEKQMTHRPSRNHPNATERQYTRMQVRVLDHKRFLEAMKLPDPAAKGKAVVAVHEGDGVSKFVVDVADGRASVKPSDQAPDIECSAHDWALVACGDLEATSAAELGLVQVNRPGALTALDVLAKGARPYCREYF